MPRIYDLYSKRKFEAERAGVPDVYHYDDIPEHVINQISIILTDAIGRYYVRSRNAIRSTPSNANDVWDGLIRVLVREYGDLSLSTGHGRNDCFSVLRNYDNLDRQLSFIELALRVIEHRGKSIAHYELQAQGVEIEADDAIHELNYRLREGGVGYQYENGRIFRVDSQYVHKEIVKKALALLHSPGFEGPEQEFMEAHTHYREGNYRSAVVNAHAAFESVMKAICDKLEWQYDPKGRASDLLRVLRTNRLFPDYLDKSFEQLLAVLQSGLPKVRDNQGSHGQGSEPKQVPPYIAAFALHLAAAKIVFLVEAMQYRVS